MGPNTKTIALQGKIILPKFNEGHVHPTTTSRDNYTYGFSNIQSLSDFFGWINKQVKEKGKLANLIVISEDFLTCETERIKDINVELTMLDGKIIYNADLQIN